MFEKWREKRNKLKEYKKEIEGKEKESLAIFSKWSDML